MSLCELCAAEIDPFSTHDLPAMWFHPTTRQIGSRRVSPTVWQIATLLWNRRQRDPVSRNTLYALLYAHKPNDPPCEQTINVFISFVRNAFKGTPYTVVNYRDVGWKLVESPPQ
jgi:hypothetical protein